MSDQIAAAQQAIEQILAGLHIEAVVCIDDIYGIDDIDSGTELVIGWFSEALKGRKVGDCGAILGESSFFDVPDEEVWKRRLRDRWQKLGQEERTAILDRLAGILDIKVNIKGDRQSASLLKDLIPKGIRLQELAPRDWERGEKAILEGVNEENGLLCLFDHDLQGAHGYTGNSGILLLERTIRSRGNRPVICGLLTHTIKEDEEISRSSQFADEHGLRREDFLVLSKNRLGDPMRFVHGLKMMSINHARDFLTSQVKRIAEEADTHAKEELMKVDVYNFDHMVLRSSEKEGIWEAETLFRLFEILRRVAFQKEIFALENRTALDNRIVQIRTIREVKTLLDEQECPPNQRFEIRRLELYESKTFVNEAHLPLELGDIFEAEGSRYILIAQPCDLMIREDGNRKAKSVILARIIIPQGKHDLNLVFNFPLEYFDPGSCRKECVRFRETFHVSPDILDLAVFNSDGQCKYDPSIALPMLHTPWRNRSVAIREIFGQHKAKLDEIFERLAGLSDEAEEYLRVALTKKLILSDLDIPFTYNNGVFEFGLRRAGRYRQPGATRLLNHYVAFLARDAEEPDYAA